jgi:hypothetical protein
MQRVKEHAAASSRTRKSPVISTPSGYGRGSSKAALTPGTSSSTKQSESIFPWDREKVERMRSNLSGQYLCLRLSRLTKSSGIYESGSSLVNQFGEDILQIDKLGRELTGVAVMRCFTIVDESIFSDFVGSLMATSLGVMTIKNFNLFYSFKHGKKSQSMNPMATLWNFWKCTVRDLIGGWANHLRNPTYKMMGNYSAFPIAECERHTVPEHHTSQCTADVQALLSAAVLKVNQHMVGEVEFITGTPKPWSGWFGHFFEMVKTLLGHDIEEHTDKDLSYWIQFFTDQEVSVQVSRQPIIIFFVYLEYINNEYRHTNGKTFFPWYQIESVKTFKKWFTTVLQKYILVSTIVYSKDDIPMTTWEDHKMLVDHPLMATLDLQVVHDRNKNLATDGHFNCIKVGHIL